VNWNLLGHEWAVQLLQEHLVQGRPRHAYLFTGPPGIGRRTLALRLAQALNCKQAPAPGQMCGTCLSCRQIERMQHPSLSIIQSDRPGGILKVEQVREIQHILALAPYEARYRVALLLRFEEANLSAANALLKTLEEPAAQVILVLTAENMESLLPTIVSRCEVLRLRPLPVEQVSQGLQARWGVPAEQARLLAHLSDGRPGYAMQLFNDPEQMEQRRTRLDDLVQLLGARRSERFAYIERLSKERETFRQAMQVWTSFWRDVLLLSSGAGLPVTNLDKLSAIEAAAQKFGLEAARRSILSLERAQENLERNVNPRLTGEVLMLDLPGL
jgi:DNA polymerase-3 subunit delta'